MKKTGKRSLRFRLILLISLTSFLIWLASTTVAWLQVRKEVNQVFDAQQILFAERLASSNLPTLIQNKQPLNTLKASHSHKAEYDNDALAFAVFSEHGEMLIHDGNNGENFHFSPSPNHFSISKIKDDDDDWRIFWLPLATGKLLIAVGQEIDYRDDLVNEMVFSQMWIWFASLPLLLSLVSWLISRELKTLRQVGEAVQHRTPEQAEPLSTNVPKEVLPLVESLNHFFERTADQLLRERRFTSDAAHELRSPLAGLKVQTELAQLAGDDHQIRERALSNLTQGINRATQLIDQLLTLSRLDNLKQLEKVELIEWQKLIPSLIGECYFQAQTRHIELQFEHITVPLPTYGQPLLASLMLRNLIENAIKYADTHSIVKVILENKRLIVADNGGGVNDTDLPKLGKRFYRPAGQNEKGSGLGLSIVQRIAELHNYTMKIENGYLAGKKGLRVIIDLN